MRGHHYAVRKRKNVGSEPVIALARGEVRFASLFILFANGRRVNDRTVKTVRVHRTNS